MRRPRVIIFTVWLTFSLSACTSTSVISQAELRNKLGGQGELQRRLVLTATDGSSMRLTPNTELRFLCADGQFTPWYTGAELRIAGDVVILPKAKDRGIPLRLADVAGAEVRNISGGKTLAATVAVAAIVAVIVAVRS